MDSDKKPFVAGGLLIHFPARLSYWAVLRLNGVLPNGFFLKKVSSSSQISLAIFEKRIIVTKSEGGDEMFSTV